MKLKKIISELEKMFPKNLAEEWDNTGLMVGEMESEINRIQISLDITDETVEKAINSKADLIITHHPMIFRGIKSVTDENKSGKRIISLIKNGISVYSMHTNLDSAKGGLNQYIAEKLGMKSGKIIDKKEEKIFKARIFIPVEKTDKFIEKLKESGIIYGEKYSNGLYVYEVFERYTPLNESAPFKGEVGKEEVNRVNCIEYILKESNIRRAEEFVIKNHPYEEPAYEFSETGIKVEIGGIGRVFELENSMEIEEFIKFVKKVLNIENVRVVFGKSSLIKKAAIVNGSGAEYITKLKKFGVDIYITSDIKYHEAQAGKENGLTLMDIGHFEGEVWFADIIGNCLEKMKIENYTFNGDSLFKTF